MNRELINRIRERVDIVEFIGRTVALRPADDGRLRGVCPWCRQRTLSVNRDRQSWKCPSCDAGGDVFTYVMMQRDVDFQEAISILGNIVKGDFDD